MQSRYRWTTRGKRVGRAIFWGAGPTALKVRCVKVAQWLLLCETHRNHSCCCCPGLNLLSCLVPTAEVSWNLLVVFVIFTLVHKLVLAPDDWLHCWLMLWIYRCVDGDRCVADVSTSRRGSGTGGTVRDNTPRMRPLPHPFQTQRTPCLLGIPDPILQNVVRLGSSDKSCKQKPLKRSPAHQVLNIPHRVSNTYLRLLHPWPLFQWPFVPPNESGAYEHGEQGLSRAYVQSKSSSSVSQWTELKSGKIPQVSCPSTCPGRYKWS